MARPQTGTVDTLRVVFTHTCDNCRYGGAEYCEYNGGPVWSTAAAPPCKLSCKQWVNKKQGVPAQWPLLESITLPPPSLTERTPAAPRLTGHYSHPADVDMKGMLKDLQEDRGTKYASRIIVELVIHAHGLLPEP